MSTRTYAWIVNVLDSRGVLLGSHTGNSIIPDPTMSDREIEEGIVACVRRERPDLHHDGGARRYGVAKQQTS